MPKSYQLSIENPCQKKDWNTMLPQEQGKFCTLCAKNVVDFSTWKDEEIIAFLHAAKTPICGRLSQMQMAREITSTSHKAAQSKFWDKIVATWLLLAAATNSAEAKEKPKEKVQLLDWKQQNISKQDLPKNSPPKDSTKNIIRGKVIDEFSGEPAPLATVYVKDSRLKTQTDSLGIFELHIPDTYKKKEIILVVPSGVNRKETVIKRKKLPLNSLILTKGEWALGEIQVITRPPKKWWQLWRRR